MAVRRRFDILSALIGEREHRQFVQSAPRACFNWLLGQGWTDAIRTLHPKEPMYTFWDYKRERWARDAGLRLDHPLLNRSATTRLAAAGVDRGCARGGRGERSCAGHDYCRSSRNAVCYRPVGVPAPA